MDDKTAIDSAVQILSGAGGAPDKGDYVRAYQAFSSAASVPYAKAKQAGMLAMGCGAARDIEAAATLYYEAVLTGFPPLLRDMAVILDAYSQKHLGMVRNLLIRAAGAGESVAAALLSKWEKRHPPVASSAIDTQVLRAAIASIFHARPVLTPASLSRDLPVHTYIGALTPMQCDYLIAVSGPLLQPSKVVDGDHSAQAGFRTSDGAIFLPRHMDMPVLQIITRLASLAGAAPEQGEFLALLRYRPGQEYRAHHDYLPEDAADYSKVRTCGQRRATVLSYLNAGYSGGETEFPELGLRYKGGVGDSLVFENTDGAGIGLPQSLHAGMPVTSGEKWLVTLWVRERRFWPW